MAHSGGTKTVGRMEMLVNITPVFRPRWLYGGALVAAVALVGALGQRPALAQTAAQTWNVQVGGGGDQPAGAPPAYDAQSFGPNPVIIRVGDTVRWTFTGPHTVTFNSGKPQQPDIVPGPNPGELMIAPGFGPIGVTGPVTSYDGTAQVSSGVAFLAVPPPPNGPPTFSLTFTKPGLFGYVCVIHPGMRGEVEVREAGAPLPESPAQALARGQVTLQTLAGKAKADAAAVRPVQAGTVHAALAGLGDGFGASALAMINGTMTVRRGDSVVWTVADPFEIHTVTFMSGATPPEFIEPRPQPAGPPLLVIPANIAGPAGGDSYTGTAYANSGILGPGDSYILRFDAPAGTYDYLCVIHPWMTGSITVTP